MRGKSEAGGAGADRRGTAGAGGLGAAAEDRAGAGPAVEDRAGVRGRGGEQQVAEDLGVSRATVTKWRSRFAAGRLEGLGDEPRPGAPRKITDEHVELVITKTLEERGPGEDTHWSTRSMAAATGLSQTAVSRIWRAFSLKPHLIETWKLSTDPQFIEKVRDVVGLYMDPPAGPWCCASTRSARSRRWTGRRRACRSCRRRRPGGGPMTTSATARPACSPRSRPAADR